MALRLVPMAAEAAVGAGMGAVMVRKGLQAPARVAGHLTTTQTLLGAANGNGSQKAGGGPTTTNGAAPTAAPALANRGDSRGGAAPAHASTAATPPRPTGSRARPNSQQPGSSRSRARGDEASR
jgi:hypothetical protein